MAWYNLIENIFKSGKNIAEVFTENSEQKSVRKHKESMADIDRDVATLNQFAAEFHKRENRNIFDSVADALNRLIRPSITIAVLSLFVIAPYNPERFMLIAQAYELVPSGYWALLSVIVGFYFGGRMQLKAQDMTLKKAAVESFKDLVKSKKEFRKLNDEDESVQSKIYDTATQDKSKKIKNKVIDKWLENEEDQDD
ncbi:MAG: holin family protein [Gammaproteobacteria bacterium]|nr:holin family protein [Gammaproteobacteria bacterium]